MEEFINLKQGNMSVEEYTLIFTMSLPFVLKPRDEMSHFRTGVFKNMVEECLLAMIHDNMNISRLILHAKQV